MIESGRRKIKSIARKKAARNSLWIIGERCISVGIATIITILSARYLGAENYGLINYGLAFVTLFASVMRLGIDVIIVNELINNRDKQGELLGTSSVLRLASGVISMVIIAILVQFMNADNPLVLAVIMLQSTVLIFQAFYVFDSWFQSRLESKYVSIAKIIASLLVLIYSAYILVSGKGVVWFAFSTALSSIIIMILLLYFYRRSDGQKLRYAHDTARQLLQKSYHFIISGVIVTIYIQIDKIMIANILDNAQLGIYSAALALCTAWAFIPDSIITSFRPTVFSAQLTSRTTYLKRLKQLYFLIFWSSMGISLIVALLAPQLIALLFGAAYSGAVDILRVVVWYVPLSMLGTARSIWIVGENKNKYTKYYLIYGLLVNVSLNLLLLPIIGIMGAAIATLITEFIICFIAPMFYRATRAHTKIALDAIRYKI